MQPGAERLMYTDAAIACANYVAREIGPAAGVEFGT